MNNSYYTKYVFFLKNKTKKPNNSTINRRQDVLSQNETCLALNHNLSGGMYSGNSDDANLTRNILENKLALIGRLPFECGSSSGDCFFASMAHGLYCNPGLHFQIRSAGIAHMISNPELYVESLGDKSWEHYIHEMSKQGTWCDNIIMQAVANALSCTIHITDSNPNASSATIITPVTAQHRQRIVFLGYINNLHYVSTTQNMQTNNQNANKIKSLKRKWCMTNHKREQLLSKRTKLDKQKRDSETSDEKKLRLAKKAELEKRQAYRRKVEGNQLPSAHAIHNTNMTHNISKTTYLNEFDALKNGGLHDQCWAKCNMEQFHKSMQYSIFQCTVCKEAWPINTKPKCPASYVCLRCSRDKNTPKKFCDANAMIPRPIPIELQGLTQTEEMLIARALPIMRVYIKPGGQRGYSEHCINLLQKVEELVSVLPRYPKDLTLIVVKMKGKDNTFKDLNVRRQKVHHALLWLLENNPHYRGVTIDHNALESLPIDGVLPEIMTVESDNDIVSDEMTSPDLGLLLIMMNRTKFTIIHQK